MNKKYLYLLLLIIPVVILIVVFSRKNKGETIKPQRKAITEAVYASGFLVPRNEYKVYALSDGYVVAKSKDGGDDVKKGEEIFRIQNDASAAKLGASSSALDMARMNASDNSPVLLDLKSKIKSAEAKYRNDSINYMRYKNMFDAQAVTKTQFDQIALAYEVSGNDLKSANENFKRTREQMQVELKNAQSGVAASNLDYGNYSIRSVMDGMVYDTYKDLGEAVRRNDLVALVGEKGKKILELSVDQSDVDKVKVGLEVVVKLDVTGDKIYKAKVSKVYPNMNQNDQSFKVEAEFTEDYDLNFVHVSVEANIIVAQKADALVVPKGVVNASNEVEVKSIGMNKMVKIKRGLENLEFVEIMEGVGDSEEIVVPKAK
ncbi:MAG TPA: HlyD family efflux transporter periplasmic adaptor subunit [Chitinophagales bacterium]|nr:HlyD family efflux transporter periplasmic adaptor subunit [Chitinophagales bacterium]